MKQVKIGKHDVTLYNSIEELPMQRFHQYNKMMLIDAGLGSDLNAVDGHIERAVRFIKGDHRQEAATEMENIRQTIYLIIQGMCPKHLAFAVLVAEVDGKPCDDISDEGLQRIVELLGDAPVKDMTAESEAVKKKIDDELTTYFPDEFDSASEKEYYEGHIDPKNGADWNQSAPVDTKPTLDDFKKTVADYLAWEVSSLLKNQAEDDLGK